jgi:hypothetical protein
VKGGIHFEFSEGASTILVDVIICISVCVVKVIDRSVDHRVCGMFALAVFCFSMFLDSILYL